MRASGSSGCLSGHPYTPFRLAISGMVQIGYTPTEHFSNLLLCQRHEMRPLAQLADPNLDAIMNKIGGAHPH
jgi:hypothetical protein